MPEATRHDWSLEEIRALHDTPLTDLVFRAAAVHREHHQAHEVQVCQLVSIKTGACPEDCSYCSQSAHYTTGVDAQPMMQTSEVMEIARRAKERGVSRLCLGAAWREVRDNAQFERVLEMVRGVSGMGMEVCCTLGMLNESQARRLEEAGLHAYNHNLDTSAEHYSKIITTRTQEDRLKTLSEVRKTRVTLCTGGILGLGERIEDRLNLLRTLSSLRPHPESVPVNMLSHVEGTPLEGQPVVPVEDLVRVIATARLMMPRSVVRLSAGRARLSTAEQALCFLAGANSIFSSETGNMLTSAVPSPDHDADLGMMDRLGMKPRAPFSGSDTRLRQEQAAAGVRVP